MRAPYLLAVFVAIGSGSAAAGGYPPIVQTAVDEAKASCKPDNALIEKGFLRELEANGDATPDFVLSYEGVACPDGGRLFCGSAGCLTQVFVSTPGGYVKALDENVQGVRFKRVNGRPAMLLGLHGTSCGKSGAAACGATLYWNGTKFSPAN